MTSNNGGPAFPQFDVVVGERDGHGDPLEAYTSATGGMSLRDWFAGQALSAMIAKSPFFDREGEFGKPVDMLQFKADMAESAYCYADAMLAAREATE